MRRSILLISLACLSLFLAVETNALVSYDPVEVGMGARALSLGGAFVALSDDPNALFSNPAGITGFRSWTTTGTYIFLPHTDTFYTITGGGFYTPYGQIGLGYVGSGINSVDLGGGDFTDYSDNVIFLAYGTALSRYSSFMKNFSMGLTLKSFKKGFSGDFMGHASGVNMDLGLKYFPSDWLTFGLTTRNFVSKDMGGGLVWSSGTHEDLPAGTSLGTAAKFSDGQYLLAFDTQFPSHNGVPQLYHLGFEWRMNPLLAMRLGADQKMGSLDNAASSTTNLTMGLGLNFLGFRLDYSYQPYYNNFSDSFTSIVSISYVDPQAQDLSARVNQAVVSAGEAQLVTVNAPKDSRRVYATMPDGQKVELNYDTNENLWFGGWVVPQKISGKGFVAKVYLIDKEFNKWETDTNKFSIKPSTVEAIVVTTTSTSSTSLTSTSLGTSTTSSTTSTTIKDPLGPGEYYKLQVALFSDEQGALAMAEKIKAAGFVDYVRQVGDKWRAQAGAFKILDRAKVQQEKLKKAGFESIIIWE